MKRHLAIVLVLAACIIALALYVQSDAFSVRLRPYVAGPLQEIMGPGARVGWVKANLLPPYVEARDIIVPYGGRPAGLTVRKIKLNLDLIPLLWKRISIPSVTILEPRITAARSANGQVDVAEFLQTVMERIRKRGGGGPSFAVDIRNISLMNGSLQFLDEGTKADLSVEALEILGRLGSKETLFDVRSMTGRVHAALPSYPRLDADLDAAFSWSPAMLVLRHGEITSSRLRMTASGRLGLDAEGTMDLKAALRSGGGMRSLLRGRTGERGALLDAVVRLHGTRSAPIVEGKVALGPLSAGGLTLRDANLQFAYRDGSADLSGAQWKLVRNGAAVGIDRVEARARYEKGAVVIDGASVLAGDLGLSCEGRIDPVAGYRLNVDGRSSGKGSALSVLSGLGLQGDLAVAGVVTGPLKAPRLSGTLKGGPVTIRGVEFSSIDGALTYADRSLSVERTSIVQGRSRYLLTGSVDLTGRAPVFHASLDAERAQVANIVALFYKQLPLDITATGRTTFMGTASEFSGSSSLEIDAGSAYGESFSGGQVTAELSTHRVSFPEVLLRKKAGTVRGSGWIAFDGTYSARIDTAGMDLGSIDRLAGLPLSGPVALTITSSGPFASPVVRARAESEALSYGGYRVGSTVCDITIEQGRLGLTATVQGERGDSVAMNGAMRLRSPYPWSADVKVRAAGLEASSLGSANGYLDKVILGLDADLELSGSGGKAGNLNGSLSASRLEITLGDYRVRNEGQLRIHVTKGKFFIDSFVMTGQGTSLSVSGSSGLGSGLDLLLSGDANLSLLRFVTRAVEHGDGVATANVRITDAWKDPNITGELHVKNGVVKIRDLPQNFSGITGAVTFDRNRIVTDGLRGEFGGGTITANGSAQLRNLKLLDFTTKASVDNVTIRYPVGFTATVGGVLYYDGDAANQTLSGEVNIRRARYERRVDWKSMLVDFRRGFTPRKKMDVGWIGETVLNVRFLGRDDILFENNLAKIPLELDMIIRGTVNQPQVLGHVEARKGEVYFRRNVFRILNASADFADPNRINPALDVQAETRVREYQIRLSVTGYADHATVTFVSDPPLTDANILALLAIGRTTEDIKGKEAEVGSGEAVAFATGKFQDILESRARSLTGLDRFQVDPYFSKADVAVPRVTAGKELVKDRLYVTYSSNVGATNPEQTFSIEYLMNKNMSLVGERNDIGDIGADIRFHFGFR